MFAFLFKKAKRRGTVQKAKYLKASRNFESLVSIALLENDPFTTNLVVEALMESARPLTLGETLRVTQTFGGSEVLSRAAEIDANRARAVVALGTLGSQAKAAIPLLQRLAGGNENRTMVANANEAIRLISGQAKCGGERLSTQGHERSRNAPTGVSKVSVGAVEASERCEALVRRLWDDHPILVTEDNIDDIHKAQDELTQIGKTNESVIPYLANVLETRRPNPHLAECSGERMIMIALARTGSPRVLPILEKQLMRPDDGTTRSWTIWDAAACALGQTRNSAAVAILRKGIAVRHAVSECLKSIEGLASSSPVNVRAPTRSLSESPIENRSVTTQAEWTCASCGEKSPSDVDVCLNCREPMNVSETVFTKAFPVQKENTYDGVLTSFIAVGHGKTVCISQIESQPLYIDVYSFEINAVDDLQGRKSEKSVQLSQTIPSGDALHRLAADYLAG